jgi:hypothetical protein
MNYFTFKQLDKETQVDITLEEGVMISKRLEQERLVTLYQINNFYSELYYREDLSEIYTIYHSDKDTFLEPYLNQIDIGGLVQECLNEKD